MIKLIKENDNKFLKLIENIFSKSRKKRSKTRNIITIIIFIIFIILGIIELLLKKGV